MVFILLVQIFKEGLHTILMDADLTALQWRFATKEFSDKPVSEQDIEHLMEVVRLAPSSYNVQPWHIVIVQDEALLKDLLPVSYNQPQIQTTKCLFVFCANTDFNDAFGKVIAQMHKDGTYHENYERSVRDSVGKLSQHEFAEYAQRQLYIALGIFLAALAEHKIDAGPMEGLDREGVARVLKLPKHIVPFCNVAIGYRKEGPHRPKSRLSKDVVFERR
jgi:nitroreductase / dihydropteridine reductase